MSKSVKLNEGYDYIRGSKTNVKPIKINQQSKPVLNFKPIPNSRINQNKAKKNIYALI